MVSWHHLRGRKVDEVGQGRSCVTEFFLLVTDRRTIAPMDEAHKYIKLVPAVDLTTTQTDNYR